MFGTTVTWTSNSQIRQTVGRLIPGSDLTVPRGVIQLAVTTLVALSAFLSLGRTRPSCRSQVWTIDHFEHLDSLSELKSNFWMLGVVIVNWFHSQCFGNVKDWIHLLIWYTQLQIGKFWKSCKSPKLFLRKQFWKLCKSSKCYLDCTHNAIENSPCTCPLFLFRQWNHENGCRQFDHALPARNVSSLGIVWLGSPCSWGMLGFWIIINDSKLGSLPCYVQGSSQGWEMC